MKDGYRVKHVVALGWMAIAIAACASQPDESRASSRAADTSARAQASWGMVAGSIFDGEDPMVALDDMASLGLRAVRFEAPYGRAAYPVERAFAAHAHEKRMLVLALVNPPRYPQCADGRTCDEETWLTELAGQVGTVAAQIGADAIEIGNETNALDGAGKPAIPAATFAKALVRGSAAVAGRAKVVSGGILNVNLSEPIAAAYLDDLLANLPSSAPFDAFGIHPYNPGEYVNGTWSSFVPAQCAALKARLRAHFGRDVPLWATEIGRSVRFGSSGGPDNRAPASQPQASSFGPIDATLAGIVERAFWYNYRDDEPSRGAGREDFGVRLARAEGGATKPIYDVMKAALGAPAAMSGSGQQAAPAPAPVTAPPRSPSCGSLAPEQALSSGQALASCDGRFQLVMQGDGNLVLYQGGQVLWATYTNGSGAVTVVMQGDGNLVVLDGAGAPRWDAHTGGHFGAHLAVQDDGNLVIYDGAAAVFDTGTGGR